MTTVEGTQGIGGTMVAWTFDDAKNFVIPFGKHIGKTIDQVATMDEGLRYLDWLVGQSLFGAFKEALEGYLADPQIQKEVENSL